MATYYAITTTGNGHYVLAYGANKAAVESAGYEKIGNVATGYGTDIYRATESVNMRVVSKTKAQRVYKIPLGNAEDRFNALEGATHVK